MYYMKYILFCRDLLDHTKRSPGHPEDRSSGRKSGNFAEIPGIKIPTLKNPDLWILKF